MIWEREYAEGLIQQRLRVVVFETIEKKATGDEFG